MLRNCSADTLFGKADDKLSWIASRLVQLARDEQQSWEDHHLYHAPAESWELVAKSFAYKKWVLFDVFGTNELEYLAAVRERTSERWVYYNLPF
jgi:hypothetical protein